MDARAWLIFKHGKEVVYDADTTLTLAAEDFQPFPPVPILHPSYMRFFKYEQQPFLVQVRRPSSPSPHFPCLFSLTRLLSITYMTWQELAVVRKQQGRCLRPFPTPVAHLLLRNIHHCYFRSGMPPLTITPHAQGVLFDYLPLTYTSVYSLVHVLTLTHLYSTYSSTCTYG